MGAGAGVSLLFGGRSPRKSPFRRSLCRALLRAAPRTAARRPPWGWGCRGPWGEGCRGRRHVPVASRLSQPRPSPGAPRSLTSGSVPPRWVRAAPAQAPARRGYPRALLWGVGSGAVGGPVLGAGWWSLQKPFLVLCWPGHRFLFFSGPQELAFLPRFSKSLKTA